MGRVPFATPALPEIHLLLVTVGPERGWTRKEEQNFEKFGLIPKRISLHTLRVEIATFAALSQIGLLRHRNSIEYSLSQDFR